LLQKFKVNLLGFESAVNQDKDKRKVFSLAHVAADHRTERGPLGLAHLGVPVSREVGQNPGSAVNFEQVDKLCFAGTTRGLCKVLFANQLID
jgi:hypothetical protein